MFSLFKSQARRCAEALARGIQKTGVSPTQLTLIGFLLNLLVGVVLAGGHLALGGALLLIVGAFDMLDGALARVANRATTFGAFLDSTLDRYSEAALLLGLLVEASRRGDQIVAPLTFVVIVGSLMVSYTRARSEGLGLKNEVGIAPRPERLVILGVGLIVGLEIPALAVLAVLTNVTTIQRILHVQRLLQEPGRGPESPRRPASQTESPLETR